MRAVAVVGALSVVVFAPLYVLFVGFDGILRMGWCENLLQVVVQGILAGMLPIYLFARAVIAARRRTRGDLPGAGAGLLV